MVKILKQLEDDKNVVLVDDELCSTRWPALKCLRVLDLNEHVMYPALPYISLAARDHWVNYQGNQRNLATWLRDTQVIE